MSDGRDVVTVTFAPPDTAAESRWDRLVGGRFQQLLIGNLVVASALWAGSLVRVDVAAMTDVGLVSVLPIMAFVGLGLLVIGFVLAIGRTQISVLLNRAHIVVLILFLHATPALIYGPLRYAWAWKHVGVVDYIQRTGTVDRAAAPLEVFHNWPGFFSLNAMLTEAFGLETPLSYANWMPLAFNLLVFTVLAVIMRSLTANDRVVSIALWFYVSTAWVGQDYFAPQALGFLLHLTVLALVVRFFRSEPDPDGGIGRLVARFVGPPEERLEPPAPSVSRRSRVGAAVVIVLLTAVIASSHQLTPVMLALSLGTLVALGVARPIALPFLVVGITGAWVIGFAGEFFISNVYDVIEEFGAVTDNVSGSLLILEQASTGQRFVASVARGLSATALGLGAIAGIWLLIRRRLPLTTALLAGAPLAVLALSAYGDEILFRVYLFTMPFAALLAARLFVEAQRRRLLVQGAALAVALVLLAGFLVAHYGNDRRYTFSDDEVAAAEYLYSTAPAGALVIEGSRNYPSLWINHEQFIYVPIDREPWATRERIVDDPVGALGDWLDNDTYPIVYLIITRSQIAETEAVGSMPGGGLASVETALRGSSDFRRVYEGSDATVFILEEKLDRLPQGEGS
jgi:hypothetical protein